MYRATAPDQAELRPASAGAVAARGDAPSTSAHDDRPHPVATSRLILRAILTIAAMLTVFSALVFHDPDIFGREKTLTDFDAFYVAGSLALEGRAGDAYRMDTMLAAQEKFAGTKSFMPWTYPPPFTLFVAGLAAMPIGLAFLLFVSVSFVFYLIVLRRIAGAYLPGVLIAIGPTLVLMLRTGQNGFVTGALIGLFLLALMDRRAGAGVPLGLMIIKPHLAAAIAVLTLAERRWAAVAIAAAVVGAALLVPTLVFGPAVWLAFADGVRESGQFLAGGYYPLFRMTSLYATLRTLGLPADVALALHGTGALVTIGLLLVLWRRKVPPHLLAAATCVASLLISPYNYDYDLAILGVAIAFALPDLLRRTGALGQAGLLALCWFTTGYGLIANLTQDTGEPRTVPLGGTAVVTETVASPSLMGLGLLLLVALSAFVLSRPPRAGARRAESVSMERAPG